MFLYGAVKGKMDGLLNGFTVKRVRRLGNFGHFPGGIAVNSLTLAVNAL